MPKALTKPTKIFTRTIDDKHYEFEISQCLTVGSGKEDGDIIGCPCNHTSWCNAESIPHIFDANDLYNMKTTGFPKWCPLANQENDNE